MLISTVQKYTPRGRMCMMMISMITHVIFTCLPVDPVRAMLIVHVIVTCLPVDPVLEGCLAYFALCQSNIRPHGYSDEPLIDNNLLSAQDLRRAILASALLHFHVY